MTHAPLPRSVTADDKRNNGFSVVDTGKVFCGFLFFGAANLTDKNHRFGSVILPEKVEAAPEAYAVNGVAAHADGGGLAKTCGTGLGDDLRGERG